GLGRGVGNDALVDIETERRGDVDDGAAWPAASMRRAAPCAQKNTASRLVESTRRQFSSASSTARPECTTPALLTRTVTVPKAFSAASRSEEHTSELQSHHDLVCRLLLEK